jgi:two-component system, LytTR family, sensor kinase
MAQRKQMIDVAHGEARVLMPLVALFWVGNIAATMAQVYLRQSLVDSRPSLFDLMRWVLPMYVVWLVGAPLVVVFLSRRFSFARGEWPTSVAVHAIASVVIAAAALATDTLGVLQRNPARVFGDVYSNLARGWLLWIIFTYWFFLAVVHAVRHAVTASARELRATQLEAAVATAQLAALKTQLHPHFLFNALNSVSSLIADEPRAAQKMIARLGELLRSTLSDNSTGDWPLRREIALLEEYAAIEEIRFGDRLKVDVACERESLNARVPALLLLPLVENAIVHGIQPMLGGGTVRIAARRLEERLQIDITDDGVGLETRESSRAEHIGLSNTRQRLEKRFGPEHSFHIESCSPMGTRVRVVIPWITAAAESTHVPAA